MKLRLTETQLKKAKLITEGQERVDVFMEKADDIKEKVNRLYSKLTYSTLAEILEGNLDLDVILKQLEQWRTVMYTHNEKADVFFDAMSEDEYYAKWDKLKTKVEDTFSEIVYYKIDIVEDLVDKLKDFSDEDLEKHFGDIKTMDI